MARRKCRKCRKELSPAEMKVLKEQVGLLFRDSHGQWIRCPEGYGCNRRQGG